jgi:protein TonB
MSTITQDVAVEPFRAVAETIGQVPEQHPELPCIVLAEESAHWISQFASWSRLFVSIGVSLLGHAGVLVWLGLASSAFSIRTVPVQEGHAAIELAAIMASTAQQMRQEEDIDSMQIEMPHPPDDRSSERPESMSSATSIPVSIQRCQSADLPAVEATMPDAEAVIDEVIRLCIERPDREELPSVEPSNPSVDPSPVPRARTAQRPLAKVTAEPIEKVSPDASLSSPSSQASNGANSIPAVVHNPAPEYPPEALKSRRTGRVVLRVRIAADGSIVLASIYRSSGVPSLDQAALNAVRRWRFAPAESASAPVRQIAVPIRFLIDEAETDAG